MKSQRFRFRLIGILLMGIILFAGIYGLKGIPGFNSSDASLSESIRRLTGSLPASGSVSSTDTAAPATENPVASLSDSAALPTEDAMTPPETAAPSQNTEWGKNAADQPASSPGSIIDAVLQFFPTPSPSPDAAPTPTPNNLNL